MAARSRTGGAWGGLGAWAAFGMLTLAGCGGGSEPVSSDSTTATSTASGPSADAGRGSEPGPDRSPPGGPALYFTAGEQFRKVEAQIPAGGSRFEHAAEALVAGPPPGAGAETAIPAAAEIRDVTVDGGTASVRVSAAFMNGIPADPRRRDDAQRQEVAARLGQLTYTLTQFGGVGSVEVVAGGAAVDGPARRADFAKPARRPQPKSRPRGAEGPGVRLTQERLAQLHYLPARAVDGVERYRTEQAVIAFQSWEGLERDGIVGPATTAALAEAGRPKPRRAGPARRIEVYRARGVALLIAHGKTKRAIHVSAGAAGTTTPSGTYHVFRKELRSWSVPFQVYLPYASYFNAGIAFHEYPEVPVYPASHGCVRVPAPEAPGVYRFAKIGTPVVVI